MKKTVWLGVLLATAASAAFGQESRQDVSVSAFEELAPSVYGNAVQPMTTTKVTGVLGSYRYLLTPRSGLELNYAWSQNSIKYSAFSAGVPDGRVHAREQELSAAYVYSRNYRKFNPFAEGGIGGMVFTPILDNGSNKLDFKSNTRLGGLFGAGVAYEISPSFDIRAEYRGFVLKTPDFSYPPFTSNRYYVISTPSIGLAYHF